MNWQNRIVGHGKETPSSLLANPQNWRIHPQNQHRAIEATMGSIGWIQEVIVNVTTGHLVDGHLRVMAAMRADDDRPVPVLYVELTEDEERAALATLDPIGELAEADTEALANLRFEIDSLPPELDELIEQLLGAPETGQDDEIDIDPGLPDPLEDEGSLAVLVSADSEAQQSRIYDELQSMGFDVRVVTT